ncbi:hypothetical protein BH23VER1_BH23VER1_22510 [soil metagenome]
MDWAWYAVKVVITAVVIVAVSEIGKTNSFMGSLLASIPLVSFLGMLWMRVEGVPVGKISAHAEGVFWLVLPSLPFFLMLPWMLRRGWEFFTSLGIATATMILLYFGMTALMKRAGWG